MNKVQSINIKFNRNNPKKRTNSETFTQRRYIAEGLPMVFINNIVAVNIMERFPWLRACVHQHTGIFLLRNVIKPTYAVLIVKLNTLPYIVLV